MDYLNAAVQLVPLLVDPNAHKMLGPEQRRHSIERALAEAFLCIDNAVKAREDSLKSQAAPQ